MFARGTAMQSQTVGVGLGKLGGVEVEVEVEVEVRVEEGEVVVRRGRWINIESQG